MDERINLKPRDYKTTSHKIHTVINETDKILEFEFFKGQLTVRVKE